MTAEGSRKQARPFVVDQADDPPVKLVEDAGGEKEHRKSDCSCKTMAIAPAEILPVPEESADSTPSTVIDASQDSIKQKDIESSCVDDAAKEDRLLLGSGAVSDSASQSVTGKLLFCLRNVENAIEPWLSWHKDYIGWLWSLRVPMFLLCAIALVPKLVALWIFVVLAKPVSLWVYRHCPQNWRANCKLALPTPLRNSPFLRELDEGADQGLPFILFWLYLCCAPFAVAWIALHWLQGFLHFTPAQPKCQDAFVFTQNKKLDPVHSETNFYHSRAFGIVMFAFFALGIPAFFSYAVYESAGIERMMRSSPVLLVTMPQSCAPPVATIPQVGLANRGNPAAIRDQANMHAPTGMGATVVMGYNGYWPWLRDFGIEPSKASVFFVHFYLVSLASALCMLFFRAWFLFPLNFLSDEHDVEFTASGIRRKSLKGWFLTVITINRWATGGGPDSLKWNEVKSLRRLEEGFTRLCPLPETAFKKESLSYKLLNKVAAFLDGVSNRFNTGNYLVFSCAEREGDFGRNVKINLNDLNREQRARLFYAVKKWAPHVVVQSSAEEQLLGSTVLHNERYTQLWFDMLTSRTRVKRQHVLAAGERLKGGEYTIEDRISSGGQATAYLVSRASGAKCVLKEFILAASSNSSSLVESAREFETEVSLLAQLNHPGIVRLEDCFCEDGRVYVALEYIEGQSLRQKVQQAGPLSEKEVVQIARAICDVLEYLHNCNPPIVHRDITPENILVQMDGTIKLIDFSLAVKQDGRQTTDSCAKQCFTPPEQFREEVCVQSDIYALGATMYYLLTGLAPKPISSSSPRTRAPHVSAELNAIVERATQLDLSQRYESVHWLKLDLAAGAT